MSDDLPHLDEAACRKLLHDVPVGRVAWADDSGRVAILPVNFVLDGDTLVFSTAEGAKLDAIRAGRPLTFEADDLEPALRAAWSVVITGAAELVTDPGEIERLHGLPLAPWSHSPKPFFVRLALHQITGRRIPLHSGGVTHVQLEDGPG